MQIDPIYLDATLSSTDIQHVMQERTSGKQKQADGTPPQAWLRLSDGIEYAYTGTLQFSKVPTLSGTGSVTVIAVFPNPEGQLLAGMSVRLQIREGVRNQALLVPERSVIRDTTGQASVLVVAFFSSSAPPGHGGGTRHAQDQHIHAQRQDEMPHRRWPHGGCRYKGPRG